MAKVLFLWKKTNPPIIALETSKMRKCLQSGAALCYFPEIFAIYGG